MNVKRPKATPDAIVAAARRIARERGWTAVTIRAVADELGYTSPLLYEHFRNKDDLLAAAARVGFAELEADLTAAEAPFGTDERIVALGLAYVAFAQRAPELYRVMHGLDGAVTDPSAIAAGAWRVCELACDELSRWAKAENVVLPDPLATAETFWCLVHGIASLALAGRFEAEVASRTEASVRLLLAGLRATP